MKLLWTRTPTPNTVADAPEDDCRPDPRHAPAPRVAAPSLPAVPFHMATCTLLLTATSEEQAAVDAYRAGQQSTAQFWWNAPAAHWMLDLLRLHWDWIVAPERELRRFALECAARVSGSNTPNLRRVTETAREGLTGMPRSRTSQKRRSGRSPR